MRGGHGGSISRKNVHTSGIYCEPGSREKTHDVSQRVVFVRVVQLKAIYGISREKKTVMFLKRSILKFGLHVDE